MSIKVKLGIAYILAYLAALIMLAVLGIEEELTKPRGKKVDKDYWCGDCDATLVNAVDADMHEKYHPGHLTHWTEKLDMWELG